MKQIYIITSGEYSDYHINGVYSDYDIASKALGSDKHSRIECHVMDPDDAHITELGNKAVFVVSMDRNGDSTCTLLDDNWSYVGKVYWEKYGQWDGGKWIEKSPTKLIMVVLARHSHHAVKIANEKRAAILADDSWEHHKWTD